MAPKSEHRLYPSGAYILKRYTVINYLNTQFLIIFVITALRKILCGVGDGGWGGGSCLLIHIKSLRVQGNKWLDNLLKILKHSELKRKRLSPMLETIFTNP